MNALQRASRRIGARNLFQRAQQRQPRQCHGRRNNSTQKPTEPPNPSSGTESQSPVDIPQILWYHRLGPVSDFFGWFHGMQMRRPLTVQLCTTLITYFCGDLLAQDIGGEKYDPMRTLRMLSIGAISSIPGYKWFLFLGNNFNYASRYLSIFVKVCVQQAVFTPVFNTYFFGMQAILTGESPSGVIDRIRNTVPTSMWNSLKLWPAVTAVSFAFIAPEYRFMFSGVFAVCWQGYLSFLNRRIEKVDRFEIQHEQLVAKLKGQVEKGQIKEKVLEEVKSTKAVATADKVGSVE